MENKAAYEFDDWVGTVRPDPRNTDQLTVLQGYLGASSEPGHIRVYTDESLNDFVEVPEEAIVHSVKLTPAESPLGGSKLWLRADAVLTFGDPKLANRPKSTFLEGDIMQQYGAFGQPDTTQMAGFAGGQGDTTGRAGFMGGQPDTTGPGAQAMATAICQNSVQIQCLPASVQIQCQPVKSVAIVCPVTQLPNCPIQFTRINSVCCIITRPGNGCPITCIGRTGLPCFGGTRIPCGGGTRIPTWQTITQQTQTFNQPGAGFTGQPDTTLLGGYYGTFNPYMY